MPLDRPDGDRIVEGLTATLFFTGVEAHPRADRGKGVALTVQLQGLCVALLSHEADEAGYVHACRAGRLAGSSHQRGADTGFTVLVADMLLVLAAKVADGGEYGIRRGLAEPAERCFLDFGAELDKPVDVLVLAVALADAVENLEHPLGADSARRTFPARLLLHELQEESGDVHHTGGIIHDDKTARAHNGAELLEGGVVEGNVEVLPGHAPSGGTTDLGRLEGFVVFDAAAYVVYEFPEGGADGHLHEAGITNGPGKGKHLGALAVLGTDTRVGLGALGENRGDVGVGLDVVENGWLAPQALVGREGWSRRRFTPFPLDGVDEGGFLATDECAGALPDLEVEGEGASENAVAEKSGPAGVVNRRGETGDCNRILRAHVYVPLLRPHRVGGNRHSLHHAVRIALEEAAIHERTGIALVGVTEYVLLLALGVVGEAPLEPGRKAGAAAPSEPRRFHRVDYLIARVLGDRFREPGITAERDVVAEAAGVHLPAVPEHHLVLAGEEVDLRFGRRGVAGVEVSVQQPLHGPAAEHVIVYDFAGIFGRYALVEGGVGIDRQDGACGAGAHTARLGNLYVSVSACELRLQGGPDLFGAGGETATAGAQADAAAYRIAFLLEALARCGEILW